MSSCMLPSCAHTDNRTKVNSNTGAIFSAAQGRHWGRPEAKETQKWTKEARQEMGMAIVVSLMPALTFTSKQQSRS